VDVSTASSASAPAGAAATPVMGPNRTIRAAPACDWAYT
jgi:hypothetical protein